MNRPTNALKPHAGKNKVWWTEVEALHWILERGSKEWPHPKHKPSMLVINRALRRLTLVPRFETEIADAYSGQTVSAAQFDLEQRCASKMIATKKKGGGVMYKAADVRRVFPAHTGKGRGRPIKREFDPRLIDRMVRLLLFSTRKSAETQNWHLMGGGYRPASMNRQRFFELRKRALMNIRDEASALLRAGLIDSADYRWGIQLVKEYETQSKGRLLF